MVTSEYWKWLTQFVDLLEEQVQNVDENIDPKMLAELRIAERTLNFQIEQYRRSMEVLYPGKEWFKLKIRRDAIAAKLSGMLKSEPKFLERYEEYCEALKNHYWLGSML